MDLIIGGIVGAIIVSVFTAFFKARKDSSVTAHTDDSGSDKFGAIVCRSLNVVDWNGDTKVSIGIDEHGGGVVSVYGKDRDSMASLGILEQGGVGGGFVGASGKDGSKAQLGIMDHGGAVGVFGKDGSQAQLRISEQGGTVVVFDKDAKAMARLSISEYGGAVVVFDKDGVFSGGLP